MFAAPPQPLVQTDAHLQDSFSGVSGNASVNQAAGAQHQQANVRIVGVGQSSGSSIRVEQLRSAQPAAATGVDAHARIAGSAFAESSGISGLNQSAGFANQNINALRVTVGAAPESLDDTVLSQSTAPTAALAIASPASGERVVETSDQAFAGSRGVVQLNQSAGVGNRTANSLSIRVVDRP
ncbi:adhesin [Pseudomonas sp. D(2018)]|uniref:adhesin n=1 Tax=Pseudomonas sp. D(2018) TaxID=2502238 RepID=UPI0021148BE4|nr:adhesin [Pseudomonas sp. D(2018)]